MITGKEELLQSLIEAYIMEKGTNDFYRMASEKSLNEAAKKAFASLAEWEARHMEYIQFLYQSIQGDRDISSFEEFKKRTGAPSVEGGIPIKDLEKRIENYSLIDDSGAVSLALEIEVKSYNLYRKISETAESTNARVFMKEMMEQEQSHINFIRHKLRGETC